MSAAATLATVPMTVMMSGGVRPVRSSARPIGNVTLETDARPRMLSIRELPPPQSSKRCHASASSNRVSRSNCGITFVSPTMVMKFASPIQRGTMC